MVTEQKRRPSVQGLSAAGDRECGTDAGERGDVTARHMRRARSDALPEHTQYQDTGCDVHPSCLTCPLVRCRYDEPGGVRRLFSEDRDRTIAGMQREGESVGAIAQRFGVSQRTVFRSLARTRGSGRQRVTSQPMESG